MPNTEMLEYVTHSDDTDISFITEIIGAENTLKLIENFGGSSIYIPIGRNVLNRIRNKNILADYKSGLSYRTISNKYGLSERYIRTIVEDFK